MQLKWTSRAISSQHYKCTLDAKSDIDTGAIHPQNSCEKLLKLISIHIYFIYFLSMLELSAIMLLWINELA